METLMSYNENTLIHYGLEHQTYEIGNLIISRLIV